MTIVTEIAFFPVEIALRKKTFIKRRQAKGRGVKGGKVSLDKSFKTPALCEKPWHQLWEGL
ncbi:hypothetical protein JZ751_017418 [Albula glossodonta]|uniref:Uncharacterized protein n=1 Tax=Albula glossodonta TaxID=121402 RepID=A0A8T2PNH0_9TELE|nr:hypothetical protein JZ751_017418 [Albula glossodonta]